MRTVRFFHENIPDLGEGLELTAEESWHAVRVLRLQKDSEIHIMNGRGSTAVAVLNSCEVKNKRSTVSCTVKNILTAEGPQPQIHLYIAPPKHKLMNLVIRMATELGVAEITPINTEFSVNDSKQKNSTEKWILECISAVKQSGIPFLPVINHSVDFETAFSTAETDGYVGAVPDQ